MSHRRMLADVRIGPVLVIEVAMTSSDELRERAILVTWGRVAIAAVFILAALSLAVWATGSHEWPRALPFSPIMRPWTAALLCTLGVAILVQSGQPSPTRVWAGRGAAGVAAALALVLVVEHASSRPGGRVVTPVLLLSVAAALMRVDGRWSQLVWGLCLLAAIVTPLITALGNLFGVASLTVGQTSSTAVGTTLLVAGALLTRPDLPPVAWLLARPDRWPLVRMAVVLAGLPAVVGLSRLVLNEFGLARDAVWALSIGIGSVLVGLGALFLGQREQRLLIDAESASRQRALAEKRFRILADNAVDVVMHMHGREATWISPSVEAALGTPPEWWIGEDVTRRVHPDDLHEVETALQDLALGRPAKVRCRIKAADGVYHWTEGHAKTYVDDEGNPDGAIAAWRVIDEQVETERRMERLAKFDALTGLVNRAEAVARLEAALVRPRAPGPNLGVLFCDIDHFKAINDTFGHAGGDAVLATVAARVRECLRAGDTVGRTGGDEMLVLLPGVHNLDELTRIAKKVHYRTNEPIHHSGRSIRVTLSIGATIAVAGESATAVTARADAAMYQAKQAGRNTTVTLSAPAEESWAGG